MADTMKRIYHPTLNEFRDVPSDTASDWKDAGWRLTNPGHVVADEGGVGEEKPVTDTYPYKIGGQAGTLATAEQLLTGPTATKVVNPK